MATKEDEPASRVLSKTFPATLVAIDGSDNVTLPSNSGWELYTIVIGAATYAVVYRIDDFDLSGYSLQNKTLFPQGVLFQDMSFGPTSGSVANLQRCTLVTTTPISPDNLTNIGTFGEWSLPGSSGSTYNLNNIIMGRLQYYLTYTTFAGITPAKQSTWGSGDSTAADKLWICDAYMWPVTAVGGFFIPDSAIVIPSIIDKEPDLEYMMRLSRSVEPVY